MYLYCITVPKSVSRYCLKMYKTCHITQCKLKIQAQLPISIYLLPSHPGSKLSINKKVNNRSISHTIIYLRACTDLQIFKTKHNICKTTIRNMSTDVAAMNIMYSCVPL